MKYLIFVVGLILQLASPVQAMDRMRVAFAALGSALSPSWVTAERGFWRKHDLNVELIYIGGGSRSVPAVLSGSIQLYLGSDTATYVAAIQGAKLVKLGVTMNTIGYFLMTPPDIRTLADLKGKVIGIGLGRDLPYIHLSKKLRDSGIDPKSDVKLLPLGGDQAGYVAALKAGRVQAAMILPPAKLMADKAGLKVLEKIDVPSLAGGVNTSEALVEKNRDMFVRFLKGYLEGVYYMISNKEESLKAFAKYLKNPDPATSAFVYDDITSRLQKDLRPNPESIRFMLDIIALDHPQAQHVSEKDYWNLSLLDEIQRSGFVNQLQRK